MSELVFEEHREFLMGLAYRMLESVADAEDAVQDTYVRWRRADSPLLKSPKSWLARTCTRLCLDRMKSVRAQRESYPGPWLPEPYAEPSDKLEFDETLSQALLIAMNRLSPKERAVFILHDVFGYTFEESAEFLDLSAANCRKLASRGRSSLRASKPSTQDAERVRKITESFFVAVESGDLDGIRSLLAEDVVLVSDGGGHVAAAPRPLVGEEAVFRFVVAVFKLRQETPCLNRKEVWFNGQAGMLLTALDGNQTAIQFEVSEGRIKQILAQRNPKKLERIIKRYDA